MNAIIREIYEWLYSIVIALAIAMVIHIFFLQPTRVSGESMVPTLHNGEYLVVEKWDHIFRNEPNYGDIVIIDSRVLYDRTWLDDAVEPLHSGDRLAFHDGKVWRNGEALDEPYINKGEMDYSRQGEVIVPEGCVFCMGDNRNHSTDSRFIGPVPLDHILGKVIW